MTLDHQIPGALDAAALTTDEYRVAIHASTYPSLAPGEVATACNMTLDAATKALQKLKAAGIVRTEDGCLMLTDPTQWKVTEAKAEAGQRHVELIDGWCKAFEAHHGIKYVVDGGRDGKAAKALLASGKTVEALLVTAKAAWVRTATATRFSYCSKAGTLHGFQENLMNIQIELRQSVAGAAPPSLVASPVYRQQIQGRAI